MDKILEIKDLCTSESNEKLDAKQVAENFGMSSCDDFMTALKDIMGEEE